MKLNVVTRSGTVVLSDGILLPDSATVDDLQARFAELKRRYYPARQRFTVPKEGLRTGDALAPGKKLSDYGLQDGSTIVFKDLGPQIGYATVFFWEYLGPLLIYPLFYFFPHAIYGQDVPVRHQAQTLAVAYWTFHYAKRILETFYVHKFSHATMPIRNLFKNCLYYWSFAAYVSYFVNHPLYSPPPASLAVYCLAAALVCQLANFRCHVILANLRPAGTSGYVMPKGFLFNYITCPNYTTEIFGWILFTVGTKTLAAGLFTLAGSLQMAQWALGKHARLRRLFDGQEGRAKYPRRVGSESYFVGLDKSLKRLKDDADRLKAGKIKRQQVWSEFNARFLAVFFALYFCVLAYTAWVAQQPAGTFTHSGHFKRMVLVFLFPIGSYALHTILLSIKTLLDKKADRQITALEGRLRKTVSAVKDSTHYEKTLQLLQKYDPDYVPPKIPGATPLKPGAARGMGQGPTNPGNRAANAAVSLAAQTMQGAGSRVMPMLSQFWSQAASTLIADDPVLMKLMREAQQQAETMQQEVLAAHSYIAELEQENAEMRKALDLPERPSALSPVPQHQQHQPGQQEEVEAEGGAWPEETAAAEDNDEPEQGLGIVTDEGVLESGSGSGEEVDPTEQLMSGSGSGGQGDDEPGPRRRRTRARRT